jgi:hypothetical protein
MDAKTKELFDIGTSLSYIAVTMSIYLMLLIIPGICNENYLKFFGTIVFLFLFFMSIRSYLIAFISMGSRVFESEWEKDWPFSINNRFSIL